MIKSRRRRRSPLGAGGVGNVQPNSFPMSASTRIEEELKIILFKNIIPGAGAPGDDNTARSPAAN